MAANLFPVDAVTGAPSYTGRAVRQTLGGLWSKATSRLLGARTGVHPATSAVSIVTATSTTWTVLPHTGVLDLEANAVAGPYDYSFDSNQTGGVTAADATNQRVDSLFVQLSDPAEGDGTSVPVVAVVYVAGTPGAAGGARGAAGGPPNFPNTRCMELSQITVPKSGGGSPVVSMVAPYIAAVGGVVPCRTSVEYPAAPHGGQYVDDAALGALLRYNATAAKWQRAEQSAVLAETWYGLSPLAFTIVSNTTNLAADIDSTNLKVTFVAPDTGNVWVELEGFGLAQNVAIGTGTFGLYWGLRDSVSGSPADSISPVAGTDGTARRLRYSTKVVGLTPGQSYTYFWQHFRGPGGTGTAYFYIGGGNKALMRVRRAN